MPRNQYIGGYFGLELPALAKAYHGSPPLANGRTGLALILAAMRPALLHVPFYACDALARPALDAGISIRPYAIGPDLMPAEPLDPGPGELVVLVNYFGLLGDRLDVAAERLGERLIVDDTQAFFHRPMPGTWAFNSARKFFGVPDGGYVFGPRSLEQAVAMLPPFDDVSTDHLALRHLGRQAEGYEHYQRSEAHLVAEPRQASGLAARMLRSIDYADVARRRRANYAWLHERLGGTNRFDASLPDSAVPLCYPYWPVAPRTRAKLLAQNIFVPTYWAECTSRPGPGFAFERAFAAEMLPLPVDQRHDHVDMEAIVEALDLP